MKIAVMGYSGSGKSTLAKQLAQRYDLPLLYLDTVWFRAGWQEREPEAARADVAAFLRQDSWVIDGNYSQLCREERLEQADRIVYLAFPRLLCLWRALRRYRDYRGRRRESAAEGCEEKLDAEFIWWILYQGRRPAVRAARRAWEKRYGEKMVVLRSPQAVKRFLEKDLSPEG